MKKKIIIIVSSIVILVILLLTIYFLYQKNKKQKEIEEAKDSLIVNKEIKVSFNSKSKVSDNIESIDGEIIDDYDIDTTKLGKQTINFKFKTSNDIEIPYSYNIEVVDNTPPVIWVSNSYSVKKGSSKDFYKKILCGDDTDPNPNCYIEGDYDLNKVGNYPVVFKAIDKSGNIKEEPITLKVYESKGSSSSSSKPKLLIQDVIKNYKTENTRIGIDVSSWQGDIDYQKVKDAGIEFVIIRVGSTRGTNGEYFVDSKFKRNIEEAKAHGLLVGLYFYSYADSEESAKKDALWLIDQIKGYDIDLPIAFDWEDWSHFNTYNISFYTLTNMSQVFTDTLEAHGYQGMLYGSKLYLEQLFLPNNQIKWLAHYTNKTNYQEDYLFWQMSSVGKIDGIKGNVDIDIMYLKNS